MCESPDPKPTSLHREFDRVISTSKVALDKLVEHAQQANLFRAHDHGELAELAADIERNGLRNPIIILPNGTIICGHQRVRAARLLGWSEIPCVVLHDLVGLPDEVERLMIEDNLSRRQLTPIEIARLAKRIKSIDGESGSMWTDRGDRRDLRDRIARRLGGMSGRTLDRYVALLKLPIAVQNGIARNEIPLSAGAKMLKLSAAKQQEIATALERGVKAADVIAEFLPVVRRPEPGAEDRFHFLVDSLDVTLEHLERGDELYLDELDGERVKAVLERAQRYLASL